MNWRAPVTPGGEITGYAVGYKLSTVDDYTVEELSIPLTILYHLIPHASLELSKTYDVRVGVKTDGVYVYTEPEPKLYVRSPSIPLTVVAQAGNELVIVTWEAPADNGGATITGYRIQCTTPGRPVVSIDVDVATLSTVLSATVLDLDNDIVYSCGVAATNSDNLAIGHGNPKPADPVTPMLVAPDKPTDLVATVIDDDSIGLIWIAPTPGSSPIIDYVVLYGESANNITQPFVHDASPDIFITVTGLNADTTYHFTVAATNSEETGPVSDSDSAKTAVTPAAPGVPAGLASTTITDTTIELTWIVPTLGSSAITDYVIKYGTTSPPQETKDSAGAGTTALIDNLTPDTPYYFTIAATNSQLTGNPSSEVTISTKVTPAAPAAPTVLRSTATTASTIDLTWAEPTATGSSPIISYTIQYGKTSGTLDLTKLSTGTGTTVTLDSLDPNTPYYFTITATNSQLTSTPSIEANARTTPGTLVANPIVSTFTIPVTNAADCAVLAEITTFTSTGTTPTEYTCDFGSTKQFILPGDYTVTWESSDGTNTLATAAQTITITELSVSISDTTATLTWTDPGLLAYHSETLYTIVYNTTRETNFETVTTTTPTGTVTGLQAGKSYDFVVQIRNNDGSPLDASQSITVVVPLPPDPPSNVIVTSDSANSLFVIWDGPDNTGGGTITAYQVQYRERDSNDDYTPLDAGVALDFDIDGLTNGQPYEVRVGVKTNGSFVYSEPVYGTPYGQLGRPVISDIQAADRELGLSWVAIPPDSGLVIDGYIILCQTDDPTVFAHADVTSDILSVTFDNLTNGVDYACTVSAYSFTHPDDPDGADDPDDPDGAKLDSDRANSDSSASRTVTPSASPKAPGAPTITVDTATGTTIVFSWSATPGTLPITHYILKFGPDEANLVTTHPTFLAKSIDIRQLDPETTYYISVTAVNSVGSGVAATASISTTVAPTVPGKPVLATPEPDTTSVTLKWIIPDDGGDPITDYEIKYSTDSDNIDQPFAHSPSPAMTITITNLDDTESYYFTVAAINSAGTGEAATTAVRTTSAVRADEVYSDDGTIKIRFSPRIDESTSDVETGDFTVSDGTNDIDITDILLTKYKVILTLATPVDAANIDGITVSYDPQYSHTIDIGTIELPDFVAPESIESRLPGTISTIRADSIYSNDGTIKINFSPHIDVDASNVTKDDFKVSSNTVTDISLKESRVVLILATPVTADIIANVRVSYIPQGDSLISIGTATLPAFSDREVTNLFTGTTSDIVRADYVYSDDGKIKIRFSPRIDESISGVDAADFTVYRGTTAINTTEIDITGISLSQYKVILTLATPVDAANIDDITVSYDPQGDRSIGIGNAVLPDFATEPVENILRTNP